MNVPKIKSEDEQNKEMLEVLEKNGYQRVAHRRKKLGTIKFPLKVTQMGGIKEF